MLYYLVYIILIYLCIFVCIKVTGNDQLERVTFGDEDFLDEYEQHKIDNQRNWEELSSKTIKAVNVHKYKTQNKGTCLEN